VGQNILTPSVLWCGQRPLVERRAQAPAARDRGRCLGPITGALLLPPGTPYLLLLALIIFYGISGMSWSGLFITLMAEIVGRASAGTGGGTAMSLTDAGAITMPPLFGYVSDTMGSYALSRSMFMLRLILGIAHLSAVRTTPLGASQPR
jgi:MFS family permease